MNAGLPIELLFTLGPIAVLSVTMAVVVVSYIFLLIRLGKSEKDKEFLQSKIRDRTRDVLLEAHEKGLKIIREATKKAETIIRQTEIFNDEVKSQFISLLATESKKQEEMLSARTEEMSKMYEQFVDDMRYKSEEQLRIVTKDMENYSMIGIGQFREILEGEKILMHKHLEVKVDEEYKKAQKHIEDYKLDQMQKVDMKIFDILRNLTSKVLGRSLTLKDHEDLVQRALASMKIEMESEV